MSIDISRLSPAAQAQIAQKLGQQIAQKAARNKFHAVPDTRGEIRFDSRAEARRYDTLMLMLRTGHISELKLQPQFTLHEAYTTPEGKRVQAIRYQGDFSYVKDGRLVVEDVKSRATKTRVYAIKKKLLREKFGIEITEVEDG